MKTRVMVVLEPSVLEARYMLRVLNAQDELGEELHAIRSALQDGFDALLSQASFDELVNNSVEIEVGVDIDTLGELAFVFGTRSVSKDAAQDLDPEVGVGLVTALIDSFIQGSRFTDETTLEEVHALKATFDTTQSLQKLVAAVDAWEAKMNLLQVATSGVDTPKDTPARF